MKKSVVIEQRAFGMEHPNKYITSLQRFDREYPVGPWNSCIELRLRVPGSTWSTDYKNTRRLVEEFFATE